MKGRVFLKSLLFSGVLLGGLAEAQDVSIDLVLPDIQSSHYRRPYTAVWLEKEGEARAVTTIAVWHGDKEWLKDLRRWWRKTGRYGTDVDAVSSATRPAGTYRLNWEANDDSGEPLVGDYELYVEVVREHGNRTLIKQPITLGDGAKQYTASGGKELGVVNIKIKD